MKYATNSHSEERSRGTPYIVRYLCDSADDGERQRDDRPDQFQYPADDNPNEPERQQNQPDNRVEDERGEGQRPAQHEQDAPKQESDHLVMNYAAALKKVPFYCTASAA